MCSFIRGSIKVENTYPKTVKQVIKTPCDNHVVIECDEKRNQTTGNSNTSQPWMDGVPDTQRPQAHLLANPQLNQEQRNSFQD